MKRLFLILLIAFAVCGSCQPVLAADITPALTETFGHEGGFQADPDDSGNWTGGRYGVGELKGTRYGIAANSYPNEDIRNLTLQRAAFLYERDFWWPSRMNEAKNQIIANVFFDFAVNAGQGTAARILQRAINYAGYPRQQIAVDGVIGKRTITRLNSVDQTAVFVHFIGLAYGRYQRIVDADPRKAKFFRSWAYRVKRNVQRSVHEYEALRKQAA